MKTRSRLEISSGDARILEEKVEPDVPESTTSGMNRTRGQRKAAEEDEKKGGRDVCVASSGTSTGRTPVLRRSDRVTASASSPTKRGESLLPPAGATTVLTNVAAKVPIADSSNSTSGSGPLNEEAAHKTEDPKHDALPITIKRPPRAPVRHSVREAVLAKKPKPTMNIQHRLFLEPTLSRQARKLRARKQKPNEESQDDSDADEQTANRKENQMESSSPEDNPLRRSSRAPRPKRTYSSDEDTAQLKKKPKITGLKKLLSSSGSKKRPASAASSPAARVLKAPKRKMSAMTPHHSTSSCSVATFDTSRGDEASIPEGAKDLMAQADMARKKKKRKKKHRKKKRSHTFAHNDGDTAPGVASPEGREKTATSTKSTAAEVTNFTVTTKASYVTPIRGADVDRQGRFENDDSDDEVEVVGYLPAPKRAQQLTPPMAVGSASHGQFSGGSGLASVVTPGGMSSLLSQAKMGMGARSSTATTWQDRATENAAASQREMALNLQRKQFVFDYLMAAKSFANIYAGLATISDLYEQEEFPPTIAKLLLDVHTVGTLLLTRILKEQLCKPSAFGGLACRELEARLLAKRIIDIITPTLFGNMVILVENFLPTGLSLLQVLQILPTLRLIADEVRESFFALSSRLLAMGAEAGVPDRPVGNALQYSLVANRNQLR